ncbi:MAG: AAA family ATPase, partial [Chloroflexota bacterium]|nr:AAA family ATPase [Chloroflexota bacterium]
MESVTEATVAVIAPAGDGSEGALLHADRHLPPEPTPLIGRADLLEDACALLQDTDVRLVTLTGAAGAGKTRLAVATAGAVAPAFRDGARFVDLSSVSDPERVAGTIATALGVRDAGEQPLMARLQRALRDRRLLLVLDNFEQVLAAAPNVGELLAACPGVKALVTSRAALHLRWEHELAVPPLQVPHLGSLPALAELAGVPAVALFLHRARAVRHDFVLDEAGARAVAEVCVRLDGLPLAIELAASRTRVLPPAALLSRLERRLQLLVGGAPDRPTRHQTLRAALDWSHELLEAPERALLRRLAVFAGGFTLEGAAAVAGDVGPRDVLDALETLVDNSLVRPAPVLRGEARYSLLETVREYAAERLAASGNGPAVRRRHAAHYLTLAETAAGALRGATQTVWLARLE